MNSYDSMKKLCQHHGIERPKEYLTYYPTHELLDELDEKAGINTAGGTKFCTFVGHVPKNYVGTRIRLHEEAIRPDYSTCCWCVQNRTSRRFDGYTFCEVCIPNTPSLTKKENNYPWYFWLGSEG